MHLDIPHHPGPGLDGLDTCFGRRPSSKLKFSSDCHRLTMLREDAVAPKRDNSWGPFLWDSPKRLNAALFSPRHARAAPASLTSCNSWSLYWTLLIVVSPLSFLRHNSIVEIKRPWMMGWRSNEPQAISDASLSRLSGTSANFRDLKAAANSRAKSSRSKWKTEARICKCFHFSIAKPLKSFNWP